MKNFILGLFILAGFSANAQKNNPYNNFGKEYFQSTANVVEDIKVNGFRGVDQKSLDHYSSLATVKAGINTEVAKSVYEVSVIKGLNVAEIIKGSKYSQEWQDYALKSLSDIGSYNEEERAEFFHDIVEQILSSKMPDSEKELILKLVAVTHQAYANYEAFGNAMGEGGLAGRIDCGIEGPEGTTLIHPAGCVGAGAVIGGIIGGTICGPLCAVGGAIVFGVLTAIAVC